MQAVHAQEERSAVRKGFFWSLMAIPAGRRAKWFILLFWIALVVAVSPFAGKLGDVENNDAAAWLPESAESLQVSNLEEQANPDDTVPAVIVYHRDGGLTAADQAIIDQDRQTLGGQFAGNEMSPVIQSQDTQAAFYTITLLDEDDDIGDQVGTIRDQVGNQSDGLEAKVTGPAGFNKDFMDAFGGLDSSLLLATAVVVAILLLITYRSPILWMLPLITVALADQTAMALVYGLAKHAGLTVNGQSAAILPILVFGVGTDYALLLLARYREELHRHGDHHIALTIAVQRAAPAILASAATVVIGFLCLLTADLSSNKSLGPVGAIGIMLALFGMLTILPALLAIIGRRVFWPFTPKPGTDIHEESGLWSGVGKRVARRPRRVWIGTAMILGIMALGLTQMNTTLSPEDSFRTTQESIEGQQLLSASFPGGSGAPDTVVANSAAADAVQQAIVSTPGVVDVQVAGEYNNLTFFDVTLSAEPSSNEASNTIDALRDNVHAVPGANAKVGGSDAENRDIIHANSRDRMVVIPAVLAVVFVILCLLLRAFVAPIMLIGTVILSYAAALGASVLVFEHIFGFNGMDSSLPLLGFVFLVALGIDYNIFLMSRVHEEAQHLGTRAGMLKGLAVTGGVITSAGIVLAATFSVLSIMPLVQMTEIGFMVAFGVLLDTLIVRSVLVPALTFDIGRRVWWPSRLSRSFFPAQRQVEAPESIDQPVRV